MLRLPRILAVYAVLLAPEPGVRAQDFQTWNEIDFAAPWRGVDFLAPVLDRVDPNRSNPQFVGTGIMADFHLPEHLTLTGGYLFVDLPPYSVQVHAPLVAVSKLFRLGRVAISDRNRFERLFGLGELGKRAGLGASPVRYRNRLLVDVPIGRKQRWHAFADDEAFYDFEVSRWNQNRAQIGGGRRLGERLLLDIYYLRRNTWSPASATNVVGSTLGVDLIGKN